MMCTGSRSLAFGLAGGNLSTFLNGRRRRHRYYISNLVSRESRSLPLIQTRSRINVIYINYSLK